MISTYKTSVMMNTIFRTIKENINLVGKIDGTIKIRLINHTSKDIITKKFIFVGFAAWILLLPLALTSSKRALIYLKVMMMKVIVVMMILT